MTDAERLARVGYEAVYGVAGFDPQPGAAWEDEYSGWRDAHVAFAGAVAAEVRRQERTKLAALVAAHARDQRRMELARDAHGLGYLDGLGAALAALDATGGLPGEGTDAL